MATTLEDRILCSAFSFLLGDALGAPYEGNLLARYLWKMIGGTSGKMRYTDDTEMSFSVLQQFLEAGWNQDHLALRFAQSYHWSRGYGPSTARLLKAIRNGKEWRIARFKSFKEGSFGNGAAMRAPAVAWCESQDLERLLSETDKGSEITHAHPEAIEGARIVALSVYAGFHGWKHQDLYHALMKRLKLNVFLSQCEQAFSRLGQETTPREICRLYGNSMRASKSVVSALFIGLQFGDRKLQELFQFCRKMGGDVDTISAISGAIWGAIPGTKSLPENLLDKVEGVDQMKQFVHLLNRKHG